MSWFVSTVVVQLWCYCDAIEMLLRCNCDGVMMACWCGDVVMWRHGERGVFMRMCVFVLAFVVLCLGTRI